MRDYEVLHLTYLLFVHINVQTFLPLSVKSHFDNMYTGTRRSIQTSSQYSGSVEFSFKLMQLQFWLQLLVLRNSVLSCDLGHKFITGFISVPVTVSLCNSVQFRSQFHYRIQLSSGHSSITELVQTWSVSLQNQLSSGHNFSTELVEFL